MMNMKTCKKEQLAAIREENWALARGLYDRFREEYPSRDACLAELCRISQVEQLCRNCKSVDVEVIENGRAGKCFQCKSTTWFTAGTILEHVKDPESRLAAILLTTAGVVFTSVSFSKLLQISQSSAHGILKWLRITAIPLFSENSELVHSNHFSSVYCKRSRETPAGAHPVAEQQAMEEMQASLTAESSGRDTDDKSRDDKFDSFTNIGDNIDTALTEEELESQRILHLLSLSKESLSFDEIYDGSTLEVGSMSALLTVLELKDQVKYLPGGYYVRNIPKPKPAILNKMTVNAIANFIHFVQVYFGGISRRYLQAYLSAFWIYKTASDRAQNQSILKMHILEQSKNSNSMNDFVTPLWVNFAFS